jgi:hypothetical protein
MFHYRWDSPETTPSTVGHLGLIEPGQEFESPEPVSHPYAKPLDMAALVEPEPAEPEE